MRVFLAHASGYEKVCNFKDRKRSRSLPPNSFAGASGFKGCEMTAEILDPSVAEKISYAAVERL